ncbi:MAG: DUF998 domain-containing protein [Thermoplasmata archaeon]
MGNLTKSGVILFLGAFQFSLMLLIAEALRPTYSVHSNYISDLGVGIYNYIFNYSIVILGILSILSAIFLLKENRRLILPYTIILVGIGAAGVGLFPENTGNPHIYFSEITFIFSGISAILASFSFVKGPFRIISPFIGIMIIISIILYAGKNFYGIGTGGMERMIVYPTLLWALTFSGYLMGVDKNYRGK